MYFGSVKFFKHLIIGTLILIILLVSALLFRVIHPILEAKAYKDEILSGPAAVEMAGAVKIPIENDKKGGNMPQINKSDRTAAVSVPGAAACLSAEKPYQLLYPELYCERPGEFVERDNIVYLTFDDGPSDRTLEILETLKKENIKATFFLIGKHDEASKEIMRQIAAQGHTIGIHSYTHDYKRIYSSVEAFLEDFDKMYNLIYETTGVKPSIFRFPGGSVNGYNTGVYKDIIAEMTRRGFVYYDWNVTAADTAPGATVKSITRNIINEVPLHPRSIVLFHDSKWEKDTASSLDGIVKNLKNKGYIFSELSNNVKPIVFKYNK